MRTEKFDSTKDNYDSDDIAYCLENNQQELISKSDIDVIVAEVCGQNDELSWYWIIQRKDGKFIYVRGSCDYTGWDCNSSAESSGPFKKATDACLVAPIREENRGRWIQQALIRQIQDELPFALYNHPLEDLGK